MYGNNKKHTETLNISQHMHKTHIKIIKTIEKHTKTYKENLSKIYKNIQNLLTHTQTDTEVYKNVLKNYMQNYMEIYKMYQTNIQNI